MFKKRTLTLSGTATATGDIIGATDASDFASCSVQIAGTFPSGTVLLQQSNDGVNWAAARMQNVQDATNIAGAMSTGGMYRGPVCARYIKVNCNAYTSGSATVTVFLSPDPFASVVKST